MKLKCKKNYFTYSKGFILKTEESVTLAMTVGKEYDVSISKCLSSKGRNVFMESNAFLEEDYILIYYSDNKKYEEVILVGQRDLDNIMKELFEEP